MTGWKSQLARRRHVKHIEATPEDSLLRCFVSSRFTGMDAERSALASVVFPSLRSKLKDPQRLVDVDLRWGVTESAITSGQLVETCLSEVARSHIVLGLLATSTGPSVRIPDAARRRFGLGQHVPLTIAELQAGLGTMRGSRCGLLLLRHDACDDFRALADGLRSTDVQVLEYHVTEFAAVAETALASLLRDKLDSPARKLSAVEVQRRRSELFRRARADGTLGRALDKSLSSARTPVMVVADEGTGKTAALAEWSRVAEVQDSPSFLARVLGLQTRHWSVISYHCGIGESSRSGAQLIADLSETLLGEQQRLIDAPALRRLRDALPARLASSALPTIVVIDGLDQLEPSWQELDWLPARCGRNLRVVLSARAGSRAARVAKEREWPILEMAEWAENERNALLTDALRVWGKSLSAAHLEAVLAPQWARDPIDVILLAERLRLTAEHEELPGVIAEISTLGGRQAAVRSVLARVEEMVEPGAARAVMALLAVCRRGLSDVDLRALAGLPPLVVAAIRGALAGLSHEEDGATVFTSQTVRSAAEQLVGNSAVLVARSQLIAFADWQSPTLGARERCWQLEALCSWPALEQELLGEHLDALLRDDPFGVRQHWGSLKRARPAELRARLRSELADCDDDRRNALGRLLVWVGEPAGAAGPITSDPARQASELMALGRESEAIEALRRAQGTWTGARDNLVAALIARGRADDLDDAARLNEARELDVYVDAIRQMHAGVISSRTGNPRVGRRQLIAARDFARRWGMPRIEASCWLALAEAEDLLANPEAAHLACAGALELAMRLADVQLELRARHLMIGLAHNLGLPAWELIGDLERLIPRGDIVEQLWAEAFRARAHWVCGELDRFCGSVRRLETAARSAGSDSLLREVQQLSALMSSLKSHH